MHNFTVYVDADRLPSYKKDRTYFGLTVTPVLDPISPLQDPTPDDEAVKLSLLWDDSRSLARPWRWTWGQDFILAKISRSGGQLELELMGSARRVVPQTPTQRDARDWLDERADRYWASAHSKDLNILASLRWPKDREAVVPLIGAAAALGLLDGLGKRLGALRNDPSFELNSALVALRSIVQRLIERLKQYHVVKEKLEELKKSVKEAEFAARLPVAVQTLACTRIDERVCARMEACAYYQFGRAGDPLYDTQADETPATALGFLGNLLSVMAPMPQAGQLAHVVEFADADLPGAEFVFIPLFMAIQGIELTRKHVEDALEKVTWDETTNLVELPVKLTNDCVVRLRLTSIPQTAQPTIHDGLWSKNCTVSQQEWVAHAHGDVSAGFDLVDPLLAALDGVAVVPEPALMLEVAAQMLYSLVVPGEMAGRHDSTLRRALTAAGVQDLDAAARRWTSVRHELADSAEFAARIGRSVAAVGEALMAWKAPSEGGPRTETRTLLGRTDDQGAADAEVSLKYEYAGAWKLTDAVLWVPGEGQAGAKYGLEFWDSAEAVWVDYGPAMAATSAVGITLNITQIARTGLWTGRHRVVRRFAGSSQIVARFTLIGEPSTRRPVEAMATALVDGPTHISLLIEWLKGVCPFDVGRLRVELERCTNRAAIRAENLDDQIVKTLCGKRTREAYADAVASLWDTETKKAGAGVVASLWGGVARFAGMFASSMQKYAKRYWARVEESRSDMTVSTVPLVISLADTIENLPDYDDDTKPAVDPLARLAGAGVLLRINKNGEVWRCLNAAKLKGTALCNVLALPIGYDKGKTAMVAVRYDGAPVAVQPPMTDPDSHLLEQRDADDVDFTVADYAIVEHDPKNPREWARFPRLVYGRGFEVLGFFIHQTGALPKEIADPDAPWSLRIAGDPGRKPASVTYTRTTPIGAPRLARVVTHARGTLRADFGTHIPEGVHPLARDLPRVSVLNQVMPRRFFWDGRHGELDLGDRSWMLTIEGIEVRGFRSDANPVVLSVALERMSVLRQLPPVLRVERTADRYKIVFNDEELATYDRIGAPLSVRVHYVPAEDEKSQPGVEVTLWSADGPPDRTLTRATRSAAFPRDLGDEVFLSVSVDGAAEGMAMASVAFGAPRIDVSGRTRVASDPDDAPIVLLSRKDEAWLKPDAVEHEFKLAIRTGAVDIDNWERRVASGRKAEDIAQKMAEVRAGWQLGLEWNETRKTGPVPPIDLGLDDPSVTHFLVALAPLHARKAGRSVVQLMPRTTPLAVGVLHSSGAITDDYIRDLLASAIHPPNTQDIVAMQAVPGGEVWELLVWPLLPTSEEPLLSQQVSAALVRCRYDGRDWLAGPASRVLLEHVTDALPRFEDIRAALTTATAGRAIRMTFEPVVIAEHLGDLEWDWHGHRFAYLYEASLARQSWRWSGRPLEEYPFEMARLKFQERPKLEHLPLVPNDDEYAIFRKEEIGRLRDILKWEVEGFGDRDPRDYLSTSHVLRPFAVTDLRREDLEGDGRAQHWRFRMEARSRYAGLFRRGGVVSEPGVKFTTNRGGEIVVNDPWCRAFVPAVPPAVLKPPSVRVVLPLTQLASRDDAHAPPPLLVVLDDPWFDIGGLGERFAASVCTTNEVPEVGADPIRWTLEQSAGLKVKAPESTGPIGYTYDEGATAQRFAHSSFIVALRPEVNELKDWSFVKLEFRRELAEKSMTDVKAPALTSKPSAAIWCQLAADFSRFTAMSGGSAMTINAREMVATTTVSPDERRKWLSFRSRADDREVSLEPYQQPAKPEPGDKPSGLKLHRRLWAVVTRTVVDAAGQAVERYVGTIDVGSPEQIEDKYRGSMIVRLLEIESRGELATGAGLAALWPDTDTWDARSANDAAARIVKVSAPIEWIG